MNNEENKVKLKAGIVDSILDAAESLFNEHGYCPVSLELVAESAGVSKRTLYKYFGDKNGLACEVLLRRDVFFRTSLTDVVAVFTEKKDMINAIISWHIRWFNSDNYHGCMFLRAQAEYGNKDEGISSIVREHKHWIQDFMRQCLGQREACRDVSHLIMLVLEGMISYTSIFKIDNYNFAVEKKYIFDLIDGVE